MKWHLPRLTDTRLLIIGLVSITIFSILSVVLSKGESGSGASIRDDNAEGAKALREWLEESGYDVHDMSSGFLQPDEMDVIFILQPRTVYRPDEIEILHAWVKQGHKLIVAGDWYTIQDILTPYQIYTSFLFQASDEVSLAAPTLTTPPFDRVKVGHAQSLDSPREDMVVHMSDGKSAVLVSFAEGRGETWISGTVYPFTNQGLKDEASGRLIMNLLADVPVGADIGFDEGIHGLSEEKSESLSNWIFTTAAGWGILSAIGITMTFMALRGRRFGVTVPLKEERLLREPVEYIQAMATLLRRSGQQGDTLRHYRNRLRRALVRRYGLSPHMSDAQMLQAIKQRNPAMEIDELKTLLQQLARAAVSEKELVMIAMQVNDWMDKLR